jgi:hypothetical protein
MHYFPLHGLFGGALFVALALLLTASGVLETIGYALVATVALAEVAMEVSFRGIEPPEPPPRAFR